MRNDFCVFILTHERPDNVMTYETLKKQGCTYPIFLVVDDLDPTLKQYQDRYKEEVIVFSKKETETDSANNFESYKGVVYARNASFKIAKDLGYRFFCQMDDDYDRFSYSGDGQGNYLTNNPKIENLNNIFDSLVKFLENTKTLSIAMAQNGDFAGGPEGTAWKKKFLRKAMNSFICDTEKPIEFIGEINEDVSVYSFLGRMGELFFTTSLLRLKQQSTQKNKGGLTEIYLEAGTYVKSFYSVMFSPSSVSISLMGESNQRLHHRVDWNATAPKILSETHRKD